MSVRWYSSVHAYIARCQGAESLGHHTYAGQQAVDTARQSSYNFAFNFTALCGSGAEGTSIPGVLVRQQ